MSSQLRTRHLGNPHNDGGDIKLDIRSDSTVSSSSFNYAKYGKKKRIKRRRRFSLYVVFIVASLSCLVYFLAVAFVRLGSNGGHSKSSASKFSQQQKKQRPANPTSHALGPHPVLPKKNKDIAKTPQTVNLNNLGDSITSKKAYSQMKNHETYDVKNANYGDLEYEPLQQVFQRKIDDDESAAFDPQSIAPETKERSKLLAGITQNIQGNFYPQYVLSDGGMPKKQEVKNASYNKLLHYYDDDNVEVLKTANDDETAEPRACRSAEFENFYFPNCNDFHEIDLGRPYDDPVEMLKPRPENQLANVRYLSHGYYRDVWIVEDNPWIWPSRYSKENENKPREALGVLNEKDTAEMVKKAYRTMVLKTLRSIHKMDIESFKEVQNEAVIMERMTKSPRIMNLYGHCGFSVSAELVPIEFEERVIYGEGYATVEEVAERNKNGLRPYNNFTAEEKLGFALEMAESIADLHGFEDGVIVHDDVQLCQWMTTADGKLKLGDFNRATIMQWDEIKEGYCKFNNGMAYGNYRAPEEFDAINLDEKIDTFSFCNNIYALITGLWNFYDTDDDEKVHEKLIDGKLAFVDPRWKDRSYEEGKLVELLPKCWAYDPDKRISIFDAVKFLRQAVQDKPKKS